MFFSTSAVSSTNLRIDTRLCKLRDTPFAAFFSDVLLFEDMLPRYGENDHFTVPRAASVHIHAAH